MFLRRNKEIKFFSRRTPGSCTQGCSMALSGSLRANQKTVVTESQGDKKWGWESTVLKVLAKEGDKETIESDISQTS